LRGLQYLSGVSRTLFLRIRCAFFLALALFALGAQGAELPRKVASFEGVTEYRLDNGLRVLLVPAPGVDTVTVHITYLVGSRHEDYGEKGMAHLLEHMLFKGTKRHPDVKQEAEARGAMLEELARFTNEAVTPDELRGAIGYLAGQAAVQRQSAGHLLTEIADAWMLGEGLDELEDPGAPYRRVTADAVWAVARASLQPARRAEGVVRGTGGGR